MPFWVVFPLEEALNREIGQEGKGVGQEGRNSRKARGLVCLMLSWCWKNKHNTTEAALKLLS